VLRRVRHRDAARLRLIRQQLAELDPFDRVPVSVETTFEFSPKRVVWRADRAGDREDQFGPAVNAHRHPTVRRSLCRWSQVIHNT
jgi:hypothetical protein